MNGEKTISQCSLGVFSVRCRRCKITAHSNKHFNLSVPHRFDRLYGIVPWLLRWLKIKFNFQRVKKCRAWIFYDPHGAVTLYITVTSDGTKTSSRLSYISL